MKKLILTSLFAALGYASTQGATIVVNEIYGGGGNGGATYNQDYVELFNNSASSVDISGYLIQYGVAAQSTFTTVATIPASTLLAAGAFYVVTASSVGVNGIAVPNVNLVGANTNLSGSDGKVRLTLADGTTVNDLVGYGSANAFEGTAAAPGPSNTTTSVQRIPNGVDTDINSADFLVRATSPGTTNVPEPSTLVTLLGGVGVLMGFRRLRDTNGSTA